VQCKEELIASGCRNHRNMRNDKGGRCCLINEVDRRDKLKNS